jgi:hypothetical protein
MGMKQLCIIFCQLWSVITALLIRFRLAALVGDVTWKGKWKLQVAHVYFRAMRYRIKNITGRMQPGVDQGNWKLQFSPHFSVENQLLLECLRRGNRFSMRCSVVLHRKVSSFRGFFSLCTMPRNVCWSSGYLWCVGWGWRAKTKRRDT